MSEELKAAKFLFTAIQKKYPTFYYPDDVDFEAWQEVLSGCSQNELIKAFAHYRATVEYNKAPNPAEFKKCLQATKNVDENNLRVRILKCADEIEAKFGIQARNRYIRGLIDPCGVELKPETEDIKKTRIPDLAVAYMQRDIKLGRCRHLLPVYQAAVRYIAEDILAQEIPVTEWRRMSFAERCEAAMKRGLFNRFDEVLVLISRRDNGKDYQFESGSQIVRRYDVKSAIKNGVKQVAAHFRTDDAEMAKTAGF